MALSQLECTKSKSQNYKWPTCKLDSSKTKSRVVDEQDQLLYLNKKAKRVAFGS